MRDYMVMREPMQSAHATAVTRLVYTPGARFPIFVQNDRPDLIIVEGAGVEFHIGDQVWLLDDNAGQFNLIHDGKITNLPKDQPWSFPLSDAVGAPL